MSGFPEHIRSVHTGYLSEQDFIVHMIVACCTHGEIMHAFRSNILQDVVLELHVYKLWKYLARTATQQATRTPSMMSLIR
jgi:hypothetical protein